MPNICSSSYYLVIMATHGNPWKLCHDIPKDYTPVFIFTLKISLPLYRPYMLPAPKNCVCQRLMKLQTYICSVGPMFTMSKQTFNNNLPIFHLQMICTMKTFCILQQCQNDLFGAYWYLVNCFVFHIFVSLWQNWLGLWVDIWSEGCVCVNPG